MLTSKRIDGDYSIVSTDPSGTISLITGATGVVSVPGDLLVGGTATFINQEDLAISDNIIVLNDGEAGPGITVPSGTAGIEISRSDGNPDTTPSALLFFDEDPAGDSSVPPRWMVNEGAGAANLEIITGTIGAGSPLFDLIGDLTPELGGELNVRSFGITNSTDVGSGLNISLPLLNSNDVILSVQHTSSRIRFDGPAIISGTDPSSIPAVASDALIIGREYEIATAGTGDWTTAGAADSNIGTVFTATATTNGQSDGSARALDVALFEAAETGGGTQLHYRNDTTTGELISKNKAIMYSLIF